jgi:hypothetical protein
LKAIVVQIVGDNKGSVDVFRFGCVESSCESQADLLVHPFEEVFLGRFGNQAIDIA